MHMTFSVFIVKLKLYFLMPKVRELAAQSILMCFINKTKPIFTVKYLLIHTNFAKKRLHYNKTANKYFVIMLMHTNISINFL